MFKPTRKNCQAFINQCELESQLAKRRNKLRFLLKEAESKENYQTASYIRKLLIVVNKAIKLTALGWKAYSDITSVSTYIQWDTRKGPVDCDVVLDSLTRLMDEGKIK